MTRDPSVPVDLTATTPDGPQTRDPDVTRALDRVERLRYHRRSDGLVSWSMSEAAQSVDTYQVPAVAFSTAGCGYHFISATTDGTTYGDFPSASLPDETGLSYSGTGWGHSAGTVDRVGGLWFDVGTPITEEVYSAKLSFRAGAGTVSGVTWRVKAVKAVSPVLPPGGYATTVLGQYASPGWTTEYTEFSPVALTTYDGATAFDITDIINELVQVNGTTGTSIMLAFYVEGGDWTINQAMNVAAYTTFPPKIDVIRTLSHRDFQRKQIAGGTVLFFWPFDAIDCGTAGYLTSHRAVVAPIAPAGGEAGIDVTDDFANFEWLGPEVPATFYARPDKFGVVPISFPSELEAGGYTRQFLGPLVDDSDPSKVNWTYGSDILSTTNDYLWMHQVKVLTDQGYVQILWDSYGDLGMGLEVTRVGTNQIRARASWTGNDSPYTGKSVTITDPDIFTPGACVSFAFWYDSTANQFNFGYNVGAGWNWSTPWSDTGSSQADISGLQFGTGGSSSAVIQGWIVIEKSTVFANLAAAEAALTQMRDLWEVGIKSLPPVLYA